MENTLEQKLQEYRNSSDKCSAAYDIYDELEDKQRKLNKELKLLVMQKYLPIEKLKSLLPWLTENALNDWVSHQDMTYQASIYNDAKDAVFRIDIDIRTSELTPMLYIHIRGKDSVKIALNESEDVVNDAIAYHMQIINETRDEFLNKVKTILAL